MKFMDFLYEDGPGMEIHNGREPEEVRRELIKRGFVREDIISEMLFVHEACGRELFDKLVDYSLRYTIAEAELLKKEKSGDWFYRRNMDNRNRFFKQAYDRCFMPWFLGFIPANAERPVDLPFDNFDLSNEGLMEVVKLDMSLEASGIPN